MGLGKTWWDSVGLGRWDLIGGTWQWDLVGLVRWDFVGLGGT